MHLFALLQQSPLSFTLVCLVLGLIVGSFLNVVIHRLPIMLEREWKSQCREMLGGQQSEDAVAPRETFNLVAPGSRCPHCGAAIKAWQNIPVLSYLLLRGRCANCRAPISLRYPAVELLAGLASAAVAWHFGFGWQAAGGLALTWALIALAGIDLDHQLLPDVITLPLLWLGLALSLLYRPLSLSPAWPISPATAIIGALAGYLTLWLIFHAFRLATGKEGMGYGDFKLLAALGAWLGWKYLPLVIVLSAAVGLIVAVAWMAARRHQRGNPIPFGPFLAAAGWISLLWGEPILRGYLHFAGLR